MPSRLDEIKERAKKATKGPWKAMEDGNQYIHGPKGDRYLPTAKVVASARVDGLIRPWNPHAVMAFMKLDDAWVCRFLSDDAQFIAHSRDDVSWLVEEVERLRGRNVEIIACLERRVRQLTEKGWDEDWEVVEACQDTLSNIEAMLEEKP